MIKSIINNGIKSRSIQWAVVGTTVLTTLIASEDTLTLIMGEAWAKSIILGVSIINGVIVVLMRGATTKSLEEL